MRAALLWTINDFPAYGYLSGWGTSGYKACPQNGLSSTIVKRFNRTKKNTCYFYEGSILNHQIFPRCNSLHSRIGLQSGPEMTAGKHRIVELQHLWDIPQDNNVEDLLEDVNLLREDIAEEIVENVDVLGSDGMVDDFIDDELNDSDHSMEDFASEFNVDNSDTDKSDNEIEDVESDDDDL
ncbi:hypothetical protein L1987_80713 [Smallanthus sonchifolius]|uniref:Uncharacterized protein n=1 Tax=Smallanthus sonchifolius TaxID=185202 RepID=A0ACB8YP02_9ASTR|nr:hypothetical protein L1987_80713 [Smallanthus sonchifolius]